MAGNITAAFQKLNPFSSKDDDEAKGEEVTHQSVAGGGRAARKTEITEHLTVSAALRKFLADHKVLSQEDVGLHAKELPPALKELVSKPHIQVPPELTDRSHPLSEYYISSSHNTYLTNHQLVGESSAHAYELHLKAGARCVEIDAWDNDDNPEEPKVTHGYTLASHISFRSVCETIRDVVDHEEKEETSAAPILLSLENHCDAHGQLRLAQIMREVWGDRLLSKTVRDEGTREQQNTGDHVDVHELGNKIAVIVEYFFPKIGKENQAPIAEPNFDENDPNLTEDQRAQLKAYEEQKKTKEPSRIIPELAELGVYAQSVKPLNNSWFEDAGLNDPHHHLINVSESALTSLLPTNSSKVSLHNAKHLMRVYPKGTRISSANLNPVPFWAVGAQIAALNWQTFDAAMQLNEALFASSDGYILKPAPLRSGGPGRLSTGHKTSLKLHVAGASDLAFPEDRRDKIEDVRPYVTCTLVHPDNIAGEEFPKRKTGAFKHHKLGILHRGEVGNPSTTDPVWDEVLEWEFEGNDMVFLRILVKSDDKWARNPVFSVAAVRLAYVRNREWVFIRLLDLKGQETRGSLLVKFDIGDV